MHVDVTARRDVLLGIANGEAVLDDLFPRGDGGKGNLVPGGNRVKGGDGHTVHGEDSARVNGTQRDGDVILRGDAEQFSHGIILLAKTDRLMRPIR